MELGADYIDVELKVNFTLKWPFPPYPLKKKRKE